jgi:small-conductance mechanosensitive channel
MTQIVSWLDQRHINAVSVVDTVGILVLASIIIFVLSRLLWRWLTYLQARVHVTDETNLIISRSATAALWILTVFMILNLWGVGLGGVWALLVSMVTVVGVGFLATWTMISNITANFFLMLWRPFHFGETVEILPENLSGRVTDRNLMFTTLREESGNVLRIPNNLFFQKIFRVGGHAAVGTAKASEGDDSAPLAPEMGSSVER